MKDIFDCIINISKKKDCFVVVQHMFSKSSFLTKLENRAFLNIYLQYYEENLAIEDIVIGFNIDFEME